MAHYKGAASDAGRAMQLMKKREQQLQDIEIRKKKIEDELKLNRIENKFATHYDAVEQQLKVSYYLIFHILYGFLMLHLYYFLEFDNWSGHPQ